MNIVRNFRYGNRDVAVDVGGGMLDTFVFVRYRVTA